MLGSKQLCSLNFCDDDIRCSGKLFIAHTATDTKIVYEIVMISLKCISSYSILALVVLGKGNFSSQ